MDTSLLIALIGLLASAGSFLAGLRMRRAETAGVELQNMRTAMQTAINTWREIAENQAEEIAELRREINGLKQEIISMERLYRKRLAEQCQTCTYRKPTVFN